MVVAEDNCGVGGSSLGGGRECTLSAVLSNDGIFLANSTKANGAAIVRAFVSRTRGTNGGILMSTAAKVTTSGVKCKTAAMRQTLGVSVGFRSCGGGIGSETRLLGRTSILVVSRVDVYQFSLFGVVTGAVVARGRRETISELLVKRSGRSVRLVIVNSFCRLPPIVAASSHGVLYQVCKSSCKGNKGCRRKCTFVSRC